MYFIIFAEGEGNMNLSVAIDGPAGAGKSTIAKLLASKLDLMYINTGAMYRAVALFALRNNVLPEDLDKLVILTKSLKMKFAKDELYVNDENVSQEVNSPYISSKVSDYAKIKEVRVILVELQREMAKEYGVVMDGRDIGTVVLKEAPYKFYLTATAEERARRRYKELCEKSIDVSYDDILLAIKERDHIDSTREVDPLKMAEDAILVDSSSMTINEVVLFMKSTIEGEIRG